MKDYQSITKNHLSFWEAKDFGRPLLSFFYGGWVFGPRMLKGAKILQPGVITPDDIVPEAFLETYEEILSEQEEIKDDKIIQIEPLPPLPWMEAYFGSQVNYSGEHLWTEKVINNSNDIYKYIEKSCDERWLNKYIEFIELLDMKFGSRWAVSQTINRGLSDVVCSLFGEENLIFEMYDNPDVIHKLFDYCKENSMVFYKKQSDKLPMFFKGNVIGQYFLWAPGTCLRIQEDAVAILSPELFREFIKPRINEISNMAEFVLMHIHLTSLHVLQDILEIPGIKAIELDIDEGSTKPSDFIEKMVKIQESGKRLVVKGRFDRDDLEQIKQKLDYRGVYLIPVVDSLTEVNMINDFFGLR